MARPSDKLSWVVTRPEGSDRWPPAVGTKVPARATASVCDMYDHALEFFFKILGVKGNTPHLQHHGDHTPWSAGKKRGWVYAIDLDMPKNFGPWFIAKCKSDYDTMWVDFWNFGGRQYDNAGNDVGSSGDHHLHISSQVNYETRGTSLIKDYGVEMGLDVTLKADERQALFEIRAFVENIDSVLMRGRRAGEQSATFGGGQNFSWLVRSQEALALEQKAAAAAEKLRDDTLKSLLDSAIKSGGSIDSAAIVTALNKQIEAVRLEFVQKLQEDQDREAKAAAAAATELAKG